MADAEVGSGRRVLYCPVCDRTSSQLGPGPGGRPGVMCVHCGSLDRHRVMAPLAMTLIDRSPADSLILDVAPMTAFSDLIRGATEHPMVTIDLDPNADGRVTDARASITALPLRDRSVGFLLCSHVLEHVPDDGSAMSEVARVLHLEGVALIQVPRRRGGGTHEDLGLTPEQREQRYGQPDHIRLYGDDFEDRLTRAGLKAATTSYSHLLPPPILKTIGVDADHELWVTTTGHDPHDVLYGDAVLDRLLVMMMATMTSAEIWRSNYDWLRQRWPIRAASTVKKLVFSPLRRNR